MDSALSTIGLPIAVGIVMLGLGLTLTVADFRRVLTQPVAVVVALVCQLVLLPPVCFGLVVLFDLPPLLGVGMMLLAASPGGTSANLFSHLFRGDVALNISLTALNSVIAIVTLPLITNFALAWYDLQNSVSLQFGKIVEVFAIVLVPVVIGMVIRARAPAFATRMDRPVRIASLVVLLVLVAGILVDQRAEVGGYFAKVGVVVAIFCAISLAVGFFVPRLFGVTARQAIACSFEIGVHNATLAIFIAVEVLDSVEMSIPAAVYGLVMLAMAAVWGFVLTRYVVRTAPPLMR